MKIADKYRTARHQGGKIVMHPGKKSLELAVALRNKETGEVVKCKAIFSDVIAFRQTPDITNIPDFENIIGCMEIMENSAWTREINELRMKQGLQPLTTETVHFIQYYPPDDFMEILAGSVRMLNEQGNQIDN